MNGECVLICDVTDGLNNNESEVCQKTNPCKTPTVQLTEPRNPILRRVFCSVLTLRPILIFFTLTVDILKVLCRGVVMKTVSNPLKSRLSYHLKNLYRYHLMLYSPIAYIQCLPCITILQCTSLLWPATSHLLRFPLTFPQ